MIKQKDIFLGSEGDAWYARNKAHYQNLPEGADALLDFVLQQQLSPKKVLEIGCANGRRLELFHKTFDADCYGVDVSTSAIKEGESQSPALNLTVGSADKLDYPDESFDMIIFGFCLYLCDRNDLFQIAAQADRVLKDGGYIIIQDFHPATPYKNEYSHKAGIFSYKMNNSNLFLWNPAYSQFALEISTHGDKSMRVIEDERVSISLLYKDLANAYRQK
ncbi:class I SAM-dependent methyltransferase [Pseudoalteromonas ulvae]|uniref:Methyltransferase type 11 domain-containing protein n=1 Tax=Pseudoalteromonas ulvae TaxID=107327 RepID=A0A244CSL4_PSEDV|nr:class I SAM-dependent methyltransferase [Pseudoalteromonas ulvae]OUL58581.1 hypothetical protein B1199_09685 [Pseudoalteromonas ulvae]